MGQREFLLSTEHQFDCSSLACWWPPVPELGAAGTCCQQRGVGLSGAGARHARLRSRVHSETGQHFVAWPRHQNNDVFVTSRSHNGHGNAHTSIASPHPQRRGSIWWDWLPSWGAPDFVWRWQLLLSHWTGPGAAAQTPTLIRIDKFFMTDEGKTKKNKK